MLCKISEHKIHLQEDYRCQVTTHFDWDHLDVGILMTDSFLPHLYFFSGLSQALAWHEPDFDPTGVNLGVWDHSPLKWSLLIGSPPFNVSHLKPQPDLSLTPKSAIYFLPWAPNWNHSFPTIDIAFLCQSHPVPTSQTFMMFFPCFCAQQFFIPNSTYSLGIFLEFPCETTRKVMSRGH